MHRSSPGRTERLRERGNCPTRQEAVTASYPSEREGDRSDLTIGGNAQIGKVVILNADGKTSMTLESSLNGARLRIQDAANHIAAELVAGLNAAVLSLGGPGFDGNVGCGEFSLSGPPEPNTDRFCKT
jgi:hypothetical protein